MSRVRRRWCRCGGSLVASSTPQAAAERVVALWASCHVSSACEITDDARVARRLRASYERDERTLSAIAGSRG